MSKIAYDPVKDKFAGIIRRSRLLRKLFYIALDLFFLRSWHVRGVVKNLGITVFDDEDPAILDAGNGFGQYDRFLLKTFPSSKIKAVDVKQDYLDDCRFYFKDAISKGKISFEEADLLKFDEPENYELVLCVDVLEHIEEDVLVMKNILKSMKPGGYFVMHSPSIYAEDDAGDDEFFVDEHARPGYEKSDLAKRLLDAGLEPVEIRYTYGLPGHTAWVMLIKYPMLLINRVGFISVFLLPFYYLITFLPGMLLHYFDLGKDHDAGTGIIAVARKPN